MEGDVLIMAFKYSCFIRANTKELREKLEEIGYQFVENDRGAWHIKIDDLSYLKTDAIAETYNGVNGKWDTSLIDCGYNIDLFLALVAINNKTDKHQWFICTEEYISTRTMQTIKIGTWQVNTQFNKLTYGLSRLWKKATKEEIIKHFQK